MKTFRIERTELQTREWYIDAETAEEALAQYMDEDDNEEYSYHSGHPEVTIEDVER